MKVYHVAALSENHVIAKDGGIPWMIKDDLRRFKEITTGHPIIMGRTTFESLGSKPLPSRINVVLSRREEVEFGGETLTYEGEQDCIHVETDRAEVVFARSIVDALADCADYQEVYVIGGGEIYRQTLHLTDELRLTIVHEEVEEDDTCVYYPELDEDQWMQSFVETCDTHSYVDYVRVYGN
jgi:dihydrofolate reductase